MSCSFYYFISQMIIISRGSWEQDSNMSWLGVNLNESLTKIGGQISNLTREVLADDLEDEGLFLHDRNAKTLLNMLNFR